MAGKTSGIAIYLIAFLRFVSPPTSSSWRRKQNMSSPVRLSSFIVVVSETTRVVHPKSTRSPPVKEHKEEKREEGAELQVGEQRKKHTKTSRAANQMAE
jgi:hypothetical protein